VLKAAGATLPPSFAVYLEILGASTSWNTKGLSRPAKGQLNFTMQQFYYLELFSYNMRVFVLYLFVEAYRTVLLYYGLLK
jgi:hypothetical protein